MLTLARAATSRIVGRGLSTDSGVNVGLPSSKNSLPDPGLNLLLQSKRICDMKDNVVF
jgi:hypothetical protein